MSWLVPITVLISVLLSLMIVPAIRGLSLQLGLIDEPDKHRKLQRSAVALGGGLAVFLTLCVTFASTIWIDRAIFGGQLGNFSSRWYFLFGCAGSLLCVGLVDDIWALRGRQKLLLQCLIVVAMVGSGTVIRQISFFGWDFQLGVLAFPLTVLWLIVAINALNLIDGADGMAATAGTIICIGLGCLCIVQGSPYGAIAGFALAGAQLGFLVYNRPPASIYLGDAGSMMIGLFVGALAIWGSFKESAALASAPIAILAIPLFDSTAAVLRRWLTGRSIYVTDRAHLHHLLQEKYGIKKMLFLVASLCLLTTTLSVLSVVFDLPVLAALGVLIVLGMLIVTRSFGHAEAKMLVGRATHFAKSFAVAPHNCDRKKIEDSSTLQGTGSRHWDLLWESLVEFAKLHDLVKVKLDINVAWLHEGYHANWQSIRLPDKASQLSIRLPLFVQCSDRANVLVGRLEFVAPATDEKVYEKMGQLSDFLVDLTPQVNRVVECLEAAKKTSCTGTPEHEREVIGGQKKTETLEPMTSTIPG